MTDEEIKRMDIAEFRDAGYLQEVNRQFLHPLGLALELARDVDDDTGEKGPWRISGVWDYRDDPEGMMYDPEELSSDDGKAKAKRISAERAEKAVIRAKKLGFIIQPMCDSRSTTCSCVVAPTEGGGEG